MSICIFVKGASNRGKSYAICALGLHSEGNPGCGSVDWIIDAVARKGCDIVVAACRAGGSTQGPAIDFLNKNGHDIMKFYPRRKPNSQYTPAEIKLFSEATALSLLHHLVNL